MKIDVWQLATIAFLYAVWPMVLGSIAVDWWYGGSPWEALKDVFTFAAKSED